jgi:hypothetical protein
MKIQYKLPVSIFREGKTFIAYTPLLDLSTSAKSFEGVKRRFGEVVQIFFDELKEAGTLEEVLTNYGWKKVQQSWEPPMMIAQELTPVHIPLTA